MSQVRARKTTTPSTSNTEALKEKPLKPVPKRAAMSNAAIPTSVLAKLAFFTILIFTLPIGVYFGTIDNLFGGESLYSAICAVVAANVVLIAYVIVAFMEDDGTPAASAPASSNKNPVAQPEEKKKDI
ncbi:hypothetical protein BDR26DRAFT_826614 [Obelidium mucronatum]|nr:hypothetical protein BDR26DRAFT_826614 [Obelidium mucronatum]